MFKLSNKKILLAIGIVFLYGAMNTNKDSENTKEITKVEETKVTKKEKIFFEEIGYCKFENKDRHFMYYTNETDKSKLIEFARKKMWTPRKFTYVTFFNTNNENIVKSNTLYTNDREKGFLLIGLVSDNSAVIGTYRKAASRREFWHNGATLITGGDFEEIQ